MTEEHATEEKIKKAKEVKEAKEAKRRTNPVALLTTAVLSAVVQTHFTFSAMAKDRNL